jgi:hypothetical protein
MSRADSKASGQLSLGEQLHLSIVVVAYYHYGRNDSRLFVAVHEVLVVVCYYVFPIYATSYLYQNVSWASSIRTRDLCC